MRTAVSVALIFSVFSIQSANILRPLGIWDFADIGDEIAGQSRMLLDESLFKIGYENAFEKEKEVLNGIDFEDLKKNFDSIISNLDGDSRVILDQKFQTLAEKNKFTVVYEADSSALKQVGSEFSIGGNLSDEFSSPYKIEVNNSFEGLSLFKTTYGEKARYVLMPRTDKKVTLDPLSTIRLASYLFPNEKNPFSPDGFKRNISLQNAATSASQAAMLGFALNSDEPMLSFLILFTVFDPSELFKVFENDKTIEKIAEKSIEIFKKSQTFSKLSLGKREWGNFWSNRTYFKKLNGGLPWGPKQYATFGALSLVVVGGVWVMTAEGDNGEYTEEEREDYSELEKESEDLFAK